MTTEERLENLERELARARRVNRWMLAAVGLALGALVLAGALGPRTAGAQGGGAALSEVRAMKFVLVDDAGKAKAVLRVAENGPVLTLFDAAGKSGAMMLRVNKDVPALILFDAAGKVRAMLDVDAHGPRLALVDAAGETRAMLREDTLGPTLTLYDAAGKVRVGLAVLKDGPRLDLYDENGKATWKTP